jgi:hypothetical protein
MNPLYFSELDALHKNYFPHFITVQRRVSLVKHVRLDVSFPQHRQYEERKKLQLQTKGFNRACLIKIAAYYTV